MIVGVRIDHELYRHRLGRDRLVVLTQSRVIIYEGRVFTGVKRVKYDKYADVADEFIRSAQDWPVLRHCSYMENARHVYILTKSPGQFDFPEHNSGFEIRTHILVDKEVSPLRYYRLHKFGRLALEKIKKERMLAVGMMSHGRLGLGVGKGGLSHEIVTMIIKCLA